MVRFIGVASAQLSEVYQLSKAGPGSVIEVCFVSLLFQKIATTLSMNSISITKSSLKIE